MSDDFCLKVTIFIFYTSPSTSFLPAQARAKYSRGIQEKYLFSIPTVARFPPPRDLRSYTV
jgi:hypothetical protein